MKMKKICYVVTIPRTIEAFFIPQLKFLAENNYMVTVVCSTSEFLQRELGNRVRFVPIDIPRGISIGGSLSAIKKLTAFFRHEQFDLIQYSTPNAAFYASIAAKRVGCKIRNYHLMGFRYLSAVGAKQIFLRAIEKITCYNSSSIECVSRSNLELGIRDGIFSAEKATVVWNGSTGGVDLSRFSYSKRAQWRKEIRSELGFTDNDFVYGFVGRITRDKGINELLEAFLSLNSDGKLFLIGRMENEASLNADLLKKARNHPNIQFHDVVPDIERYYAAIDVLILPSYREGFGNVIIEAGAVGTPAIVSNIPGPIDAIDRDKTALVVPARDAEALADAMEKIRSLEYLSIGKRAAEFVKQKYDSEILCRQILERKKFLLEEMQ